MLTMMQVVPLDIAYELLLWTNVVSLVMERITMPKTD